MSIHVCLRRRFTDAASATHTINTAWAKKWREHREQGKRKEKERKREALKRKGGGRRGMEEEMGDWGRRWRRMKSKEKKVTKR